jgi:hypothetical protein
VHESILCTPQCIVGFDIMSDTQCTVMDHLIFFVLPEIDILDVPGSGNLHSEYLQII